MNRRQRIEADEISTCRPIQGERGAERNGAGQDRGVDRGDRWEGHQREWRSHHGVGGAARAGQRGGEAMVQGQEREQGKVVSEGQISGITATYLRSTSKGGDGDKRTPRPFRVWG